jgi:hypothetical protein
MWQLWIPLGNFQEGSRKVLKFDTLVFQYNNDYFVFHLYGTPFCIDAALMEMSMAIILYQCIATTQCQLSLFGQAKFLLSTTTPILFSICMARLFVLMQLLWKFVLPQPNANFHFSAKQNFDCQQQRPFCFPLVWHALLH